MWIGPDDDMALKLVSAAGQELLIELTPDLIARLQNELRLAEQVQRAFAEVKQPPSTAPLSLVPKPDE